MRDKQSCIEKRWVLLREKSCTESRWVLLRDKRVAWSGDGFLWRDKPSCVRRG